LLRSPVPAPECHEAMKNDRLALLLGRMDEIESVPEWEGAAARRAALGGREADDRGTLRGRGVPQGAVT